MSSQNPIPERPDPLSMLAIAKREEQKKKRGKLKIFFGMSAGVGKTYAMLSAAHQKVAEGLDVLVGIVETHGRSETEKLLQGLTILPRLKIEYRGTVFSELDLDGVLRAKPDLVLIDELAHSNVPGSRHPKRWQDVIEILDAEIDVFTTLNVQHLESRKDIVEGVTGIPIRETVPDWVLERADEIQLVDLSPASLLQRLKEGKVYLGEQPKIALQNFFKEDHLTALREIALRFIAEKVDQELHGMIDSESHPVARKVSEKLLVAVSPSPHSQNLIRTTRRLAYRLTAPWIALYVDRNPNLSEEESSRLSKNLALARDLGAEVLTTVATDLSDAIQRIARQKNVTQIVMGRPTTMHIWDYLRGGTLLDKVAMESSQIDLYVSRQVEEDLAMVHPFRFRKRTSQMSDYVVAFIITTLITGISYFIEPWIGYKSVGFIYLLGIMFISLMTSGGPIFFGAILSAIAWNIFFMPPYGALEMHLTEDLTLFFIYFLSALITGILVGRIRDREHLLAIREERTQVLYDIVKTISNARNPDELNQSVTQLLNEELNANTSIILKGVNNKLQFPRADAQEFDPKLQAVAQWVFEHSKPAGWSTETLASVNTLFLPMEGFDEVVGLLTLKPNDPKKMLTVSEENFLYTICQQLGKTYERWLNEERNQRKIYVEQLGKIKQAIIHTFIRTPPVAAEDAPREHHAESISEASKLAKMAESSILQIPVAKGQNFPAREMHSVSELIEACYDEMSPWLKNNDLVIELPEESPVFSFDLGLMVIALTSLVQIAMRESEPNTQVHMSIISKGNHVSFKTSWTLGYQPDRSDWERHMEVIFNIEFAVIDAIVDLHKGKTVFDTEENGRTSYTIEMPL
jgi:two-component system sensor histidine kinase KdpD